MWVGTDLNFVRDFIDPYQSDRITPEATEVELDKAAMAELGMTVESETCRVPRYRLNLSKIATSQTDLVRPLLLFSLTCEMELF